MAHDEASSLDRALARAHRRSTMVRVLGRGGPALAIAGAGALVGAVVLRLQGVDVGWPLVGVLVIGALIGAVAPVVVRRRRPMDDAIRLDHALQLKDSLGTAASLTAHSGPLGALVVADAAARSRDLDWKRAIPIHVPATIWIGILVCGGALGAAVYVPVRVPSVSHRELEAQTEAQRRQEAAAQLADARESIRSITGQDNGSSDDPTAQEQEVISALDRLSEQLSSDQSATPESLTKGGTDVDSQIADAARQMSNLADEFDRQAAAAGRTADSLRDRLEKLKGSTRSDSAADSVIEALSRGDLQEASEQIDALNQSASSMSDEEREQAARNMADAAKALREQEAQRERELEEQRSADREALESQGIDESTQEEWEQTEPSAQEIAQELRRQGHDGAEAQRLARQWSERLDEQQAEQEANEQSREIADGLDEVSKSLNEPPTPDESLSEQAPREERQPGDQPQEQVDPDRQGGETGQEQERQENRQAEPSDSNEPGEQVESLRESEDETGETRDIETPTPDSDQPPDDALERLQETLRRIDRMPEDARRQGQVSEELRRQAEELAKRLSPEEREQIERWAREQQRQDGAPQQQGESDNSEESSSDEMTGSSPEGLQRGPALTPHRGLNDPIAGQTENRMVRPDEARPWEHQVIEDWYPPEDAATNDQRPRTGAGSAPLRRAAQATERALEEQRIAPRYRELIKRWARRWKEEAEKSEDDR